MRLPHILCVLREQACFVLLAVRLFIARIFNLRPRYFLTRSNTLRLRFIATPAAVIVALVAVMTGFATQSGAIMTQGAVLQPLTVVTENHDKAAIGQLLDGSRYGQLSLASIARAIPQPTDKIVTMQSGDALGVVMQKAGVGGEETHEAIVALSKHFDPRHLRPGQDVRMHFIPGDDGAMQFASLKIDVDPVKTVVVERQNVGFTSGVEEKEVERRLHAKHADIELSLYGSAAKFGIPSGVINDVIRVYSWDVDFQRDIQPGDSIEVLYDTFETEEGHVVKSGDVLYAKLVVGGVEKLVYRYEMADGGIDYFEPSGKSIRKALLSTPVDGARISSGFGMRHHPVLGYSKMHKGTDFAAPTGTPIYAAGDGVIEKAGRWSSYGNYVRIRHNSGLKTAYAHMHKISVREGARVKQGDVIGAVGTTGRSTGPHLHYEVMVNGAQVNPRSIDLPTGVALAGKDLQNFKDQVRKLDADYADLLNGTMKVAQRSGDHSDKKRYN